MIPDRIAAFLAEGGAQGVVPAWIAAIAAALTLLVAAVTLFLVLRDRTPRVDLVAVWDLPRDVPQASKGPGMPATSDPGKPVLRCEITNVGKIGVKITEARVWIDSPPGKPIPLRLPGDEQPRKLDTGDSQTWSAGPFDYRSTGGFPDRWTHVLAMDSAGNTYVKRNDGPGSSEPEGRPWWRVFSG